MEKANGLEAEEVSKTISQEEFNTQCFKVSVLIDIALFFLIIYGILNLFANPEPIAIVSDVLIAFVVYRPYILLTILQHLQLVLLKYHHPHNEPVFF